MTPMTDANYVHRGAGHEKQHAILTDPKTKRPRPATSESPSEKFMCLNIAFSA